MIDAGLAPETGRNQRRSLAAFAAGLLPVAALVALLLRAPDDALPSRPVTGQLTAKGAERGIVLGVRCPDRRPGECRWGDRLLFELEGTERGGYLVAYAVCKTGERIWYFPNGGEEPPAVRAQSAYHLLDHAARIGDEHGTGVCSVHLRLVDRPIRERSALAELAQQGGREFVVPIIVSP